ncbi:MAG: hypothetical protein HY819_21990 [Acidobacteria bacterium]|nr:hypothetical protein [Acidobacteriota bacterium]
MLIIKSEEFVVIDPCSQIWAIAKFVKGWQKRDILSWLSLKGNLELLPNFLNIDTYELNTIFGFRLIFILDNDQFTVISDHSSYLVTT